TLTGFANVHGIRRIHVVQGVRAVHLAQDFLRVPVFDHYSLQPLRKSGKAVRVHAPVGRGCGSRTIGVPAETRQHRGTDARVETRATRFETRDGIRSPAHKAANDGAAGSFDIAARVFVAEFKFRAGERRHAKQLFQAGSFSAVLQDAEHVHHFSIQIVVNL